MKKQKINTKEVDKIIFDYFKHLSPIPNGIKSKRDRFLKGKLGIVAKTALLIKLGYGVEIVAIKTKENDI